MPLDTYQNLQKTVADWLARPDDSLLMPAIPDMIVLWEEEARDRFKTRFQEETTTLTPGASSDTLLLPNDYVQMRELWVNTNTGKRVFTYQTPRNLDMNFAFFTLPGYPVAYTIEGLTLRVVGTLDTSGLPGPVPTNAPVSIGDLPPPNPQPGDLWWDSASGDLFIWYVDPTSSQWVAASTVSQTPIEPPPDAIHITYMQGLPALSDAVPTNWLLTNYPSAYLWGTLAMAAPYIGDDPRLQIWLGAREASVERIKLADRKNRYPEGLMIQTDVRNP